MTSTRHRSNCCATLFSFAAAFWAFLLFPQDRPGAMGQAILYDNTDHLWSLPHTGPRNVRWVGPSAPGEWYEAQPFNLGAHDSIASVSIPMARGLSAAATGTIRFSIWDDNGRGFPGQEVGELGVINIESLPRFDFLRNQENPQLGLVPNPLPSVTFDAPIDDLVPGETYYVAIDYHDLSSYELGNLLTGLSSTAGASRIGGELYGDGFPVPPFEDSDWVTAVTFFSPNQFLQMSVTSADEPYRTIVCPVGTTYHEDFALGDDGQATTFMPTGWAFSDNARTKDFDDRDLTDEERILRTDTRIFDTSITEDFPAGRSLGTGTPVFNAGEPGDLDRALALGVTRTSDDAMLQLVAEVAGGEANSIQLAFDIEAWDAANSRNNPGEAAFNVALDLDTGQGFQQIMDLGKVTTGATLVPPTEDFVNGNDDAYRTSFDSGLLNAHLPEGSKLRVRWMADLDANTRGWVFGLDNVSLGMFADMASLLGDFDGDGILTASDIGLLTAEILNPTGDLGFDINGDGTVDLADHQHWVEDDQFANTFLGDADLNKTVEFADFVALADSFGQRGGWAEGDFDGNGKVEFPDFVLLAENFGDTRAAAAAVPEPNSVMLLALGLVGVRLNFHRRRDR